MGLLRSVFAIALLAIAGFAAWKWNQNTLKAPAKSKPAPVVTARPMDFESTLLVTGTLEPAGTFPIVSVEGRGTVEYVVPDGLSARAGDVIVKLDTRDAKERLNSLSDRVEDSKQKLEDARTGGERRLENGRSAVTMAQQKLDLVRAQNAANLERAQAEVEQTEKERDYAEALLGRTQRLFDQGLATRDQLDQEKKNERERVFAAEKAKRALAIAGREAAQQERTASMDLDKAKLDLTDAETGSRRSIEAAQHALQGLQTQVEDLQREIQGCTLRTGVAGLVLLESYWRDEGGPRPLHVGDQVWPGMILARVIDPRRVRVDCEIEQADVSRIRRRQKVRLRVGTAQGSHFPGSLESIDNIATEPPWWSSRGARGRRAFSALVAVDASDKRLRPGTTAWLELVIEKVKGKIGVPLQSLFQSGGKTVVYRKRGKRFEEVPVTLGPRSDLYCAVLSGLRPGDIIATARPRMGVAAASASRDRRG